MPMKKLLETGQVFLRKSQKQKKALQHTFITTYGLKQNKYSGMIQSEVTMDDLFQL